MYQFLNEITNLPICKISLQKIDDVLKENQKIEMGLAVQVLLLRFCVENLDEEEALVKWNPRPPAIMLYVD